MGVRVMTSHFASNAVSVKADFLHIVEVRHSFVETMPYEAGSSAQRIRIGLTGLACAFLLVLLGSIISRSSRGDDAMNATEQAAMNTKEPSEPLAELGVAPGASSTDKNSVNENKSPARGAARSSGYPSCSLLPCFWLASFGNGRRTIRRNPSSCC